MAGHQISVWGHQYVFQVTHSDVCGAYPVALQVTLYLKFIDNSGKLQAFAGKRLSRVVSFFYSLF